MPLDGDELKNLNNSLGVDLLDDTEGPTLVGAGNEEERDVDERESVDNSSADEQDTVEEGGDYSVVTPRTCWVALEGFQIASKLCLHYCGAAIPRHVLRLVAALEILLKREVKDRLLHDEAQDPQKPSFKNHDAVELLIRLCIRKEAGFLHGKLEDKYGSQIKVIQALKTLEGTNIITSKKSSWCDVHHSPKRPREKDTEPSEGEWETMCTSFTGKPIASHIFHPSAISNYLLDIVLNAATAVQLRRVALEMHRGVQLVTSRLGVTPAESDAPAGVPTRKEDIVKYITYFTRNVFSSATWTDDPKLAIEKTFVKAWDQQVGKVYVIAEELKYSIQYVARLFHVLTSNFYASHIFKDSIQRGSVVAHVPGSVLHPFQRAVLFDWRRDTYAAALACHCASQPQPLTSTLIPPAPPPEGTANLEWFIPRDRMYLSLTEGQSPLQMEIFSSEQQLNLYWRALRLHERVFNITDGAVNFAKKLLGRDEAHVMSIYTGAVELLESLADEMRGTPPLLGDSNQKEHTLRAYLCREGLAACPLLQFSPQYRVYACLELLYPLLESLRRYEEAIKCLKTLLRPLFTIYPPNYTAPSSRSNHHRSHRQAGAGGGLPSREVLDASFCLYYRSEKRGEWQHRLGVNYSHLNHMEKALGLLIAVHDKWKELSSLQGNEKTALLQMISPFVAKSSLVSVPPQQENTCTSTCFQKISQRARMLRALWNSRKSDGKPVWHAAMEFFLTRYILHCDLIAIEKSIQILHKKVYKWKPLTARMQTVLTRLMNPPVLEVLASRDDNNAKGWKDPSRGNASSSSVEGMVLHHFLYQLNNKKTQDDSKTCWNGLHCEGKWIAYLARVLLWEVFYWDGDDDFSRKSGSTFSGGQHNIWLSKFQDGPLDALNPILFAQHRHRLIEERIQFLEALSDTDYLQVIAARCIDNETPAIDVNERNVDAEGDGPLTVDKGESVPLNTMKEEDNTRENSGKLAALAPFNRIKLNGFPLLEMASAIPRKPLMQLLRYMFVDFIFDGRSSSSSGFPDLIFWRTLDDVNVPRTLSVSGRASGKTFLLMEVKSPSDELSTKQIAVNDCLLRCGFDVSVVRVKDIEKAVSRGK